MGKDNEKKNSNKKSSTNAKNKVANSNDTKASKKKTKDIKEINEEVKETKEEVIIEEEVDYNEDLDEVVEEFDDEEFDDEEVVVESEDDEAEPTKDVESSKKKSVLSSKSKKNNVIDAQVENDDDTVRIEKVPSKKNIEKIEKMAKEKKKKKVVKKDSKIQRFMVWFENNHVAIFSFIGGALLTTLIAFIIWPDRIATLKNGEQSIVKVNKENYTADELYESMKNYYSVSLLLDDIDRDILTKLYPEDKEMLKEIDDNANYYYDMYKQYYNYTKEQFLEQNGFSSHDAFLDYLKLDHRRNLYLDDYIEESLDDEEIKEYYDDNVFGDINTQHILVEVSSSEDDEEGLNDKDAKALAEKIITKLNDGTSWKDVQKKYKDQITFEDLGYQSWDASLEESFMEALEDLDDDSYSEEPVKTSYGYHVIYRLDQKDKPSLKDTKEKIIENLVTEAKADDSNLLYKSLISLRKEKNIKFNDTVMKKKYEDYCKQYK